MKLVWFHLMSYPELPEDFTTAHRSIWVDLNPTMLDPAVTNRMYNEYIRQLEYAAELGFDGVGINEHHANAYGMMPSPNLAASILARTTTDAAIVVLGDSVALYNPPTRVAEELALIDCLSGGRLVAGFPVGTPMDTTFAFGQNPAQLREKYQEGVDLIQRAWTDTEVSEFNGKYTKLRYLNCWPRPVQQPTPPIWIPGGSSIETWETCAREGFVYLFLSYFGYKAAKATMDGYWAKMKELGKELNPYAGGYVQFVGVAETEEEARRIYKEPAEYFFNRCLHIYPGFADPPGYKTVKTVRAGVEGMVERAARESASRASGSASGPAKPQDLTFDEMVEKGYVVIGNPDQVAEKLKEIAVELNVGRILTLCNFGNMSDEVTRYNTKIMAEKVLPQLRDLWDDEWEDHWWINPMNGAVREAAVPALEDASA